MGRASIVLESAPSGLRELIVKPQEFGELVDFTVVATWNWPSWEFSYHGNQQMLYLPPSPSWASFLFQSPLLRVYLISALNAKIKDIHLLSLARHFGSSDITRSSWTQWNNQAPKEENFRYCVWNIFANISSGLKFPCMRYVHQITS